MSDPATPAETPAVPETVATNPQHAVVIEHLAQLEAMLLSRDPLMKTHLLEIHKNLIQYEELTHLLTDEQIGVLMAAQQIQTNTSIMVAAKTASKRATSAAAKKITISDL